MSASKPVASASPALGDTPSTLLKRLRVMTFARVIIVGVLLGASAFVEADAVGTLGGTGGTDFFLLVVGSSVLVLSLLYALFLRLWRTDRRLKYLAYAQLGGDAAFAAALVLLTGGTSSSFTFFFSVTILLAAVVMFRPGALFQATCCTLLFITIGVLEVSGDDIAERVGSLAQTQVVPSPLDGSDRAGLIGGLIYKLINNVLAFYALAFLASHLAEALRERDEQLEETSESLEELRTRHDNIIASIPAGVMTTDVDGVVTYFNPKAETLTGVPSEAAVGKQAASLFPALTGVLSAPTSADEPVTMSSVLAQHDGVRRYLQWQSSPLRSPTGDVGFLVTLQDVTDIREMQAQVQHAERFASIGKLAASIAHEIRNPLTSISGSIQLLAQTLEVEGPNARLMTIVGNETDALNAWITDFLAYARPGLSDPLPVNLCVLLTDTVTAMGYDQHRPDVIVSMEPHEDIMVMADTTYLRQAIWNVLVNAVQASPPAGEVSCRITRVRHDGTSFVRLSIRDRGVGIDPSVADRIFDPFVTTKDSGTGLGLATSYRVVSEHHGRLTFDTAVNEGTTFHIDIPAADPT